MASIKLQFTVFFIFLSHSKPMAKWFSYSGIWKTYSLTTRMTNGAIFGTQGTFQLKSLYQCFSGRSILHPVYKWLWQCSCQNKHKVFFWLLIKDRLSTRELLRRKNMTLPNFNYVLCNGSIEESLIHLFLDCPFAIQCWAWINVQVEQSADPFQNLDNFKVQLQVPFFMEIIVLMSWTIWKIRNDMIFRQENPSFQAAKDFFKSELQYLLLRVRRKFIPGFTQWIANLA